MHFFSRCFPLVKFPLAPVHCESSWNLRRVRSEGCVGVLELMMIPLCHRSFSRLCVLLNEIISATPAPHLLPINPFLSAPHQSLSTPSPLYPSQTSLSLLTFLSSLSQNTSPSSQHPPHPINTLPSPPRHQSTCPCPYTFHPFSPTLSKPILSSPNQLSSNPLF